MVNSTVSSNVGLDRGSNFRVLFYIRVFLVELHCFQLLISILGQFRSFGYGKIIITVYFVHNIRSFLR